METNTSFLWAPSSNCMSSCWLWGWEQIVIQSGSKGESATGPWLKLSPCFQYIGGDLKATSDEMRKGELLRLCQGSQG